MPEPTHEGLKKLLWEEWDPIGVYPAKEAVDEYDAYAMKVWIMVVRHATVEEVADYLTSVQTEMMGLPSTAAHNELIAKKAVAIGNSAR